MRATDSTASSCQMPGHRHPGPAVSARRASPRPGHCHQRRRHLDRAGAQQLPEALRLRVQPQVRGDAPAEDAVHDEVDGPQVRQRVAADRIGLDLGQERLERVRRRARAAARRRRRRRRPRRPTLASPPLSPERAPTSTHSGTTTASSPAGAGDGAIGAAPGSATSSTGAVRRTAGAASAATTADRRTQCAASRPRRRPSSASSGPRPGRPTAPR